MKKIVFNKKLILALLFIVSGLLFFAFDLSYTHKRTLAEEKRVIQCDTLIPIGETMENGSGLLTKSLREIQTANYQASEEIWAARKMIDSAKQCDISKCQPVCSPEPIDPGYDCNPKTIQVPCPPPAPSSLNNSKYYAALTQASSPAACYKTIWSTCHSVKCRQEKCSGQICPKQEISNELSKVEAAFNQVSGLSGRIKDIYKNNKSDIEKSLWESRKELNKCTIIKGRPYTCSTAYKRNLPTKQECKSPINFYCCH